MKKIISMMLVALLLILSCSACGSSGTLSGANEEQAPITADNEYSHDIQVFIYEMQSGNYLDAIDEYNENIYGNSILENEVSLFLQELLFGTLDSYNQGTSTEADFDNVYSTVEKIDDTLHIITFALTDAQEIFMGLENSKANYQNGLAYMEQGDYLGAAVCFSQVSSNDVNYDSAQAYHDDTISSYMQQIIIAAEEKITNGDYETAIGIIDDAEYSVGWCSEYDDLRVKAYTMEAEESVNDALDASNYPGAQIAYENSIYNTYVSFSVETITRLETAKTDYRNSVKSASRQAADEHDYAGALKTLDNGLITLENDEELLAVQAEIQEEYDDYLLRTTPVNLIDLSPYKVDKEDGGLYASDSPTTDIMGLEYRTNIHKSISGSQTYRIDGIYKQFTGSLFVDTTKDDHPWTVSFYGDGVCIYDTTVTGGTDSIPFDVDISGINDLQITVKGGYGYLRTLYIGDPILTP